MGRMPQRASRMNAIATQPASEADQLESLLAQQHDAFVALLDLAKQQAALIESGRTEELLRLLGERQKALVLLQALSARLDPWRKRSGEVTAAAELAQAQRIRGLVESVHAVMAEIQSHDNRDRDALADAKDAVSGQITETHRRGQALGAYRQASANGPRYTDRQG